jgi:hypothetical protein
MNTMTAHQDRTFSIPEPTHADPRWVRVLARMKATSLDRRLAAGEAVASDRLLSAHASLIVGPQHRHRLADDWGQLLRTARRPISPWGPRSAVRTTAILAAEYEVRELVTMIREPVRVNPRGIALARLLLSDGAGPLYNPRGSAADLVEALRAAASGVAICGAESSY